MILTAAGLPVSSSPILQLSSHYLLSNRKIKHVNPPPTFRVLSADVQPVRWATTIKHALRRERKRKQRYVPASSVSRPNANPYTPNVQVWKRNRENKLVCPQNRNLSIYLDHSYDWISPWPPYISFLPNRPPWNYVPQGFTDRLILFRVIRSNDLIVKHLVKFSINRWFYGRGSN